MTQSLSQQIAELRGLLKAATGTPWDTREPAGLGYLEILGGFDGDADSDGRAMMLYEHIADVIDNQREAENSALIIAAVNALPALLDRIEALERERVEIVERCAQVAEQAYPAALMAKDIATRIRALNAGEAK